MTELSIRPEDITAALRQAASDFAPSLQREEVGRVLEAGDGIARISGLPKCMANEILEIQTSAGTIQALALNLEEAEIGAVVLGDSAIVEEGAPVKLTGRILSIPVGDAMMGRVIDPLGNPLDGNGPIASTEVRRLRCRPLRWSSASRSRSRCSPASRRSTRSPRRPRPAPADHRRPADRQDARSRSTRSSTSAGSGAATRKSGASTSRSARRRPRWPRSLRR
jgi:hypothetical protein